MFCQFKTVALYLKIVEYAVKALGGDLILLQASRRGLIGERGLTALPLIS